MSKAVDAWVKKRTALRKAKAVVKQTRPSDKALAKWVIKEFKAGTSASDLAELIGRRQVEVSFWLREAGLRVVQGGYIDIDVKAAAKRVKRGETCLAIAKDMGVGHSTLTKRLKACGVVVRKPSREEILDALPTTSIVRAYKRGTSPSDLAKKYDTTSANIYTLLDRAKAYKQK
jgi:hypothetical protein